MKGKDAVYPTAVGWGIDLRTHIIVEVYKTYQGIPNYNHKDAAVDAIIAADVLLKELEKEDYGE